MTPNAMVRVLTEEEHPNRMAHALAKRTNALGLTLMQKRKNGARPTEER